MHKIIFFFIFISFITPFYAEKQNVDNQLSKKQNIELSEKNKEKNRELNKQIESNQNIVICVLITILFFSFNGVRKSKNRIDELEKEIVSLKNRKRTKSKSTPDFSEISENFELKKKNNEFVERINDLNKQLEILELKLKQTQTKEETEVETEVESEGGGIIESFNKLIYFRSPSSDGNFSTDHQSNIYEYALSMFEFNCDSSLVKAHFIFCGDERIQKLVVNHPDQSIEKVCEYENLRSDYKTKIETIIPGLAKLENDKWIVTQKAKIKFL